MTYESLAASTQNLPEPFKTLDKFGRWDLRVTESENPFCYIVSYPVERYGGQPVTARGSSKRPEVKITLENDANYGDVVTIIVTAGGQISNNPPPTIILDNGEVIHLQSKGEMAILRNPYNGIEIANAISSRKSMRLLSALIGNRGSESVWAIDTYDLLHLREAIAGLQECRETMAREKAESDAWIVSEIQQ